MSEYEFVEPYEGIVVVHDSVTGEYLGCMGRERWDRLLQEDEPASRLPTQELPQAFAEVGDGPMIEVVPPPIEPTAEEVGKPQKETDSSDSPS